MHKNGTVITQHLCIHGQSVGVQAVKYANGVLKISLGNGYGRSALTTTPYWPTKTCFLFLFL